MDPVTWDLVWRRNAPDQTFFTLTDAGVGIDITGYTFAMQVRQYPGAAGDPIISLGMAAENAPGFFIDSAVDGEFVLTPPTYATMEALLPLPSSTADITKGQVVLAYDILLIAPDGVPEALAKGKLTLDSGVTLL